MRNPLRNGLWKTWRYIMEPNAWLSRLGKTAFAFRGYNIENIGRSNELLQHPQYGPIMEHHLRRASAVAAECLKRPVDLESHVRTGKDVLDLGRYAEDVALVVGVELAHLQMLQECFGASVEQSKLALGYSLGEASALIATNVYEMEELLPVPVAMADDCAALAENVSLGVLFTRASVLDTDAVRRLCLDITHENKGVIAVSTFLSPNTVLLLGQNDTIGEFRKRMKQEIGDGLVLRDNPHRWPPLHTPITWQRNIPNRAAVMLQSAQGGFRPPTPPVVSMVTGKPSYHQYNSRELLHRWVDHPQRLWDAIYYLLESNVETVVHVGPVPNIIPATLKRLSANVQSQMSGRWWGRIGQRAVTQLVNRPWMQFVLPMFSALFRAPFVKHVILEDWLLEQKPAPSPLAG